MRRNSAFTLLELLVVLAIVGILISLILGATRGITNKVRALGCRHNLRQWGLATQLYVLDHHHYLPPEGSPNGRSRKAAWYVTLPAMLNLPIYHQMSWRTNAAVDPGRSWWICPANRRRSNGQNFFHYCLNGWIDGHNQDDLPTQIWTISEPQSAVWMFDNGKLAAVAQQNNVHTNAHSRGAHLLFLDGGVQWFSNRHYWDFETGKGRVDHAELIWVP